MNITRFIKSHKELNELPFFVVFRTIQLLREKGMINDLEVAADVGSVHK